MTDEGVEEIRQARHQISEECDHDLHKTVAYYRSVEEELRKSGKFRFSDTPEPVRIPGNKKMG